MWIITLYGFRNNWNGNHNLTYPANLTLRKKGIPGSGYRIRDPIQESAHT